MTEELNKKNTLKGRFPLLLMLFLVGLGSLLLGLGVSYFLNPSNSSSNSKSSPLYTEFVSAQWRSSHGEVMNTTAWQDKILIINFWASWCPPCVEEMPMLSKLSGELDASKFVMIGVGIDSPSNIREFLTKTTVSYPVVIGGLDGSAWMKKLGNVEGALPYTVILRPNGSIALTKLGKITEDTLKSQLLKENK